MNLSFHNLRRTFSILYTRRFCMKRNLSLTTVNCLGRQLVAGVCCNSNSQRVPKSSIPHLRRIAVHIKYELRIRLIVRSHCVVGTEPIAPKRSRQRGISPFTLVLVNGAERPTFGFKTPHNAKAEPNIKDCPLARVARFMIPYRSKFPRHSKVGYSWDVGRISRIVQCGNILAKDTITSHATKHASNFHSNILPFNTKIIAFARAMTAQLRVFANMDRRQIAALLIRRRNWWLEANGRMLSTLFRRVFQDMIRATT